MGADHTTLMTAVFTQNYLHEIPTDIQLDIMNYSKSKWRLNFDNLDNNNFDWKEFDYIIDNHDMSIEQLGLEVEKLKQVWSI